MITIDDMNSVIRFHPFSNEEDRNKLDGPRIILSITKINNDIKFPKVKPAWAEDPYVIEAFGRQWLYFNLEIIK